MCLRQIKKCAKIMTTPLYHNMKKTRSFYLIKCPRGFNDVRETTDEIPP